MLTLWQIFDNTKHYKKREPLTSVRITVCMKINKITKHVWYLMMCFSLIESKNRPIYLYKHEILHALTKIIHNEKNESGEKLPVLNATISNLKVASCNIKWTTNKIWCYFFVNWMSSLNLSRWISGKMKHFW